MSNAGTIRRLHDLPFPRHCGERYQRGEERDECNAQCDLKRRSLERTLYFCVHGRFGVEGGEFQKTPNPSEKSVSVSYGYAFSASVENVSTLFYRASRYPWRNSLPDLRMAPKMAARFSTVCFYGRAQICCKTARICAKSLRWPPIEMPSIREGMQSSEMMRNSLGLNYKSAALTN